MKCAIITPIGPGHEGLFQECKTSVESAVAHSSGPFSQIAHKGEDDSRGELGRSRARNAAVAKAVDEGFEWLLFLDADDLLLKDAFEKVADAVGQYDAIWGAILEWKEGYPAPIVRDHQDQEVRTIDDVLAMDPFYSLQMGHFVKSHVAKQNPFDVDLDTGEDFDYYLRVWEAHRCVKLREPLFLNRRGMHSKGPRSATGGGWRRKVTELINACKARRQ